MSFVRPIVWGAVALVLTACGAESPEGEDANHYRLLALEAAHSDRWADAADHFARAFAMEDPVPERAAHRAWLAWRRGVALANIGHPGAGLDWLRRALRLDPTLTEVHFDLAEIHDGTHAAFVDPVEAARSYRRFLGGLPAGDPPREYADAVATARRRLAELAAQYPDLLDRE